MARNAVPSGIITTEGVKKDNVPDGVNKGNEEAVDKNVIVSSPKVALAENGIPNDGKGMPPTGEEEIKPEGQQTIDQGAGAIIKEDNVPADRANVEAPLDLTNEELFGDVGVDKVGAVAKGDEKKPADKEFVYAEGNLYWQGVGRLDSGFNLVSKEAAEKWLSHKRVRKASVSEVKEHFGR